MSLNETETVAVNTNDISWIKSILGEIRSQVIATNGRVTALELWKANMVGMIAGVSAVVGVIIALIAAAIKYLFGL